MPSFRRTLDYIYLTFFLIHIPIVFCVDIYPLYPSYLVPKFMTDLRTWYIATYNDQFFVKPPAWFTLYIWMELIYHIPLSLYAVQALWSNTDPKIPIHLLIYAIQTAVTTATCIADYMSWGGHTSEQKLELGKLYVPYLMLSVFMGVDMYSRLVGAVSGRYIGGRDGANKKRN
ncbi:Sigma intracellular receptor 2 [Pseudocercospora fuligena]|uniref:Efficient mitochondria targeting-associated protein 19 n=1 Tax=Pseudocercospora fuligena TaxID=685502 RepID=A0A8H6VP29_9PEZI|nr:Sigma intracellular receptor 2 [Pseudocercospora fuligena]